MYALCRMIAVLLIVLAWDARIDAGAAEKPSEKVLHSWYQLTLELVRHTPTYSPPVASRAFAYLGTTAFEAVATGSEELISLAGQLTELGTVPRRTRGQIYNDAVVINAAMALAAQRLFNNTGPSGQRALRKLEAKLGAEMSAGLMPDVVARSQSHGRDVARHVLAWSRSDGGSAVENMGFPLEYKLSEGAARWVPTSTIAQQQKPLLPRWGENRSFAMPNAAACDLPAPPHYSEEKSSPFYREALEVYDLSRNLSAEQRAIARFWSDDPMLSPTPPGHWISIALQILKRENASLERSVELLARLGVTLADSFIACWETKYQYDLLRPVTYIRRVIDPKWESLISTPPFPEYPSGHSTQSAAAAAVLTFMFGDNYEFEDKTHERDGIVPRRFSSFWAAAEEAAISRLYGGIHFRTAIKRGLEQGRCVSTFALALRMRR
jgi:membrane-associated phospholipid phosphatase